MRRKSVSKVATPSMIGRGFLAEGSSACAGAEDMKGRKWRLS
jgi:hypothetical protein